MSVKMLNIFIIYDLEFFTLFHRKKKNQGAADLTLKKDMEHKKITSTARKPENWEFTV